MSLKNLFAVGCVAMIALVAVAADETFVAANPSGNAHPIGTPPGEATEALFRGDMAAEIGLGCSNGSGTSGGPNDWAVGVTATLTPPFGIISTTYDIFTNVSPTITALTFKVWNAGATPGGTFAVQTGVPFAQAAHTVPIAPAIVMSVSNFYIGLGQPQSDVGIRIGMDTTTWEGSQFILAPGCGASNWTANDALGFPGNWVVRAIIDDTIPVELMTFTAE